MGQDKKQLALLLDFVSRLYNDPLNKVFIDGIRALVLNDKDFIRDSGDTAPLDRITRYLSLDYDLDKKYSADYSFIEEDPVRESLLSDFREMLRYQYGTRSHKIDFCEFCRFGVMQVEMLVNYYFEKKYDSNLDSVIQAIQQSNSKYNPGEHLARISDIPLKTKVYRIKHELSWDNASIIPFINAIEVRNRQSHRSLRVEKDKIREYEDRFKAANVWYPRYGVPNFTKAIEQRVVTQDEMNEYNFQVWLDRQPFEDVLYAISALSSSISRALEM